jgi:RimJ/RimL family protein N-acetyltransferase
MQAYPETVTGVPQRAEVVIRIALESDLEAMQRIFDALLERGDTYVLEADSSADTDAAAERCRCYWMGTGVQSFVAVHGGRVAGMYKLVPNQTGRGAHIANASFMVDPGLQGLGLGTRLGQHCLEQARLAGYLAIQYNFVVSTNTHAIALWRKLGFAIAGTLPGAFRHAQLGYVDAHVMFRRLDDVASHMPMTPDDTTVIAETGRLRIRTMALSDAPFYFGLVNDPSWITNIGDRGIHTLEDARAALERGPCRLQKTLGFSGYLLQRKSDGVPVGMCGLFKRDSLAEPDIGYALLPAFSGEGYAHEAAAAVMAYARDRLGLARLLGVSMPENARSCRLLVKLGLALEGTLPWPPKGIANLYAVHLRGEL